MRAMSSVAIARSDIGGRERASFRCGVVGSLRVRGGVKLQVVRASVSGGGVDEPWSKERPGASAFDAAKEEAEDLKEEASDEVEEGKQSLSSTMEDLKRRAGETKSHAEDTASKVPTL